MQAAPSTPIHFESAWIAHANSFQLLPLMAKGNERVQSRAKLWGYGLGKETYMQHELVVRGTTHVPHSDPLLALLSSTPQKGGAGVVDASVTGDSVGGSEVGVTAKPAASESARASTVHRI